MYASKAAVIGKAHLSLPCGMPEYAVHKAPVHTAAVWALYAVLASPAQCGIEVNLGA